LSINLDIVEVCSLNDWGQVGIQRDQIEIFKEGILLYSKIDIPRPSSNLGDNALRLFLDDDIRRYIELIILCFSNFFLAQSKLLLT